MQVTVNYKVTVTLFCVILNVVKNLCYTTFTRKHFPVALGNVSALFNLIHNQGYIIHKLTSSSKVIQCLKYFLD